jgi:iron(III) transport system permease protein
VALYVLRDFGAVTLLQFSTFTRVIYNRYLSYQLDAAATMALVLVGLGLALLYLESRSRGRKGYQRVATGTQRASRPVQLGRWLWPAQLSLAFLVFCSLVLPASGLVYWLWRGWNQMQVAPQIPGVVQNLQPWTSLIQPALHSLLAALAAALVTILLALPVAIVAVRRQGRLSRALEQITYTAHALPGIVVALALVFFGINLARPLYQTLPMLLVAYAILFLPQALGSQRVSLLQLSRGLEEAGRSLGGSPWLVFRRVTLPLMRSGILAGAALVFLTTMKELPATLILSPLGFDTLAGEIWTHINEAFFARAAMPTLLLLLLSSIPLAILTLRQDKH